MASGGLQILGIALGIIGWLGTIIICALPMWKVTAASNIIIWEGLWMSCATQSSTGQMECRVYESMLALAQELKAARALVVISILVTLLGILMSFAGGKCTNWLGGEAKARVVLAAGILFLVSGFLCLIPVSWASHAVIRDYNNVFIPENMRKELGASLFIGWGAVGLLLLGGVLLCCQCPKSNNRGYSASYSAPGSTS